MQRLQLWWNMSGIDKYITVDSKAFVDRFPTNNAFSFSNLILPPLDNSNYDLELCVMDVAVIGIQSPALVTFNIECDLIEPYQCVDGMTQNIFTFLVKRKTAGYQSVACDMHQAWHYTYYPIRETHGPFYVFKVIKMGVVKSLVKTMAPPSLVDVDIQRV